MGACNQVDKTLDSISKTLEFNSNCWLFVDATGTLLIPYWFCLPSSDGYLVE